MSEYVNCRGELKLVHKKENETYGDFCKRLALTCPGCDENLPNYYDTWEEYLVYEFYEYYVVVGENVYKIISPLLIWQSYRMKNINTMSDITTVDVVLVKLFNMHLKKMRKNKWMDLQWL